jgi:acetyl esterase/lipase
MNEGMAAAKNLNRVRRDRIRAEVPAGARPGLDLLDRGDGRSADLRRAVRWVRAHAAEYGVDPHRIGVMGFSAGGELVSLVADNPGTGSKGQARCARQDQRAAGFPGADLPRPAGRAGQRREGAPPAFLAAGSRDTCCMPPAIALYQQLVAAGVSAELHLYADTDHAFNVGQRGERISHCSTGRIV